ncbi:MAG: diphosphate--fructose-6-phosphate 1-phosphotransferase [Phycisphaerales bacterium]
MARAASTFTALVGQSGGPTAVINESLVAAVLALRGFKDVKKIYGMRHGVNGLVRESPSLIDLTRTSEDHLRLVARTPSAALGSSRDKPDAHYCTRILDACRRLNARYFFYIGGNDSSDTCRIVSNLAQESGDDLRCFHIPKTIDNDLMGSDHSPGFPSAARFLALAFMSDSMDNASLPGVKINIVMGRHAGFLTAAAAIAKIGGGRSAQKVAAHNGPHLVYVPEVPFDSNEFLRSVEAVYARLGRCQVAVSEGVVDARGRPIATTLVDNLDTDMHGNVQLSGVGALGDALADLVKNNIKAPGGSTLRVRADTFGYLQRCWPDRSPIDVKEARAAARHAVRLAAQGHTSGSIAIARASSAPYKPAFRRIELADVAGKTRHLPSEFIEPGAGLAGCGISRAYIDWCRPLIGNLPEMGRL